MEDRSNIQDSLLTESVSASSKPDSEKSEQTKHDFPALIGDENFPCQFINWLPPSTSFLPSNLLDYATSDVSNPKNKYITYMIDIFSEDSIDNLHFEVFYYEGGITIWHQKNKPLKLHENHTISLETKVLQSLDDSHPKEIPRDSEPNVRNGEKIIASPSKRTESRSKKHRTSGKEYVSSNNNSKTNIDGRSLKPPCGETCKFSCHSKFTEDQRTSISNYWKISNLEKQQEFLDNHMIEIKPKFVFKREPKKIKRAFYFQQNGSKIRVCKPFFMSTLGIKNISASTIIEKIRRKMVNLSIKNDIVDHIKSIPKVKSNYRRAANTSCELIDRCKTLPQIHQDYVETCKKQGKKFGNFKTFRRIFYSEFNLTFLSIKRGKCKLCDALDNTDELRQHLEMEMLFCQEKEIDKTNSGKNVIVASYSLQEALPTPKGEVSAFYYRLKLFTNYLTICDIKTQQVVCNVWHEGDAHRGVNEIASCVFKFIEERATGTEEEIEFIFYTDNNCTQKKNKYILAMYMYSLSKFSNVKSISHKFLICGHTYNEGDSVHSTIEKEIKRTSKGGPIFVPAQYYQLMKSAKKTLPIYRVKEFSYNDFVDFKDLTDKIGYNFSRNTNSETFLFTDIKVLTILRDRPFEFLYKLSNLDGFKVVDIFSEESYVHNTNDRDVIKSDNDKISIIKKWEEKRAYKKPVGISDEKKKDLMSLVESNHIPYSYHDFYSSMATYGPNRITESSDHDLNVSIVVQY